MVQTAGSLDKRITRQIGNLECLGLPTQIQLAVPSLLDRVDRPRQKQHGAHQPIETDFCDEQMTKQSQIVDQKRLNK